MKKDKMKYSKPAILHRDKVEVFASTCNSIWNGAQTCRVVGQTGCVKTRV